jgi:hypothetical protein
MEKALYSFLERYFDEVQLDVTIVTDSEIGEEASQIDIRVDAVITENGKKYSLGRLISTLNSKIMNIIKINNG